MRWACFMHFWRDVLLLNIPQPPVPERVDCSQTPSQGSALLGELTLSVRSAAGLGAVDWKGTCDPFVRVVCHPTGRASSRSQEARVQRKAGGTCVMPLGNKTVQYCTQCVSDSLPSLPRFSHLQYVWHLGGGGRPG